MNLLKPGAVLVPNFQHRLFLGIATFVGMLLLVGWVAVNEPARMQVFTQQYQGRSIENGAAIFLNNCATCHGVDGKGVAQTAPALNNPMLFLKDNPLVAAQKQLSDLQDKQKSIQAQFDAYAGNVQKLAADKQLLQGVVAGSDEEKRLKAEIDTLTAQNKAVSDLKAQLAQAQQDLDKIKTQGWEDGRDTRLNEVKWAGSLQDYLVSTITSGRPTSASYWPRPMPAWGQIAGGPMRPDEVRDVAQYILNFHDTAVKLTPKDVNQQFVLPSAGGAPSANAGGAAGGQPVGSVDPLKVDVSGGDAKAGEQKYTQFACAGCHMQGTVGPATKGTYTRIQNDRLKNPANAGKTPEQYIAESILNPNAFVAPNFAAGVMPQDFSKKLTLQDLKDLVAYLQTQK